MRVFDRVDSATAEKREFQLGVLSLVCIAVLGAGMALLMYPNVTEHPVYFSERTTKILFFGFCGLCLLLFGYLLNRQLVVRRLRREVTLGAQALFRAARSCKRRLAESSLRDEPISGPVADGVQEIGEFRRDPSRYWSSC